VGGEFAGFGTPVKKRVVVTGLGVVSPIGIGVDPFWKNALAGRSGISQLPPWQDLPELPLGGYRSQVAGQVLDFDPAAIPDGVQPDRYDRYAQLSLVATQEAVADSGLQIDRETPHRVGVIMGAGMGGMLIGEEEFAKVYMSNRPHRVHPNFIPMITLNSASGVIAMTFGAKGPNLTISTACSSSAHAIGLALAAIRAGQADVVLTGGAEASLTPLAFAGFCALRALSTAYNTEPTRASRPFDRARDGFVMGEGAATLVLESLDHAIKRKAPIYAEVAGYAGTSEAFHMVIPKEDGSEMAMTMTMGLRDAGVPPTQIDYINAHATSTPIGDPVEVTAIRTVFKKRADTIAVNATKSLIGHTLGAAGALGGVACVMALRTGLVHPTVNYDDPDPACELPGISAEVQERPIRSALLNAFGFGSNNAAVVFSQPPAPARGSRPRAR
jgi:3-oxoacyl-[acyl-carrier-protein] synthase II